MTGMHRELRAILQWIVENQSEKWTPELMIELLTVSGCRDGDHLNTLSNELHILLGELTDGVSLDIV
jgi:hypothetical protein